MKLKDETIKRIVSFYSNKYGKIDIDKVLDALNEDPEGLYKRFIRDIDKYRKDIESLNSEPYGKISIKETPIKKVFTDKEARTEINLFLMGFLTSLKSMFEIMEGTKYNSSYLLTLIATNAAISAFEEGHEGLAILEDAKERFMDFLRVDDEEDEDDEE